MTRSERLRVDKAFTRRRNRFWLGVFGLFATTMLAVLAAWTILPVALGWFPYAIVSNSMGPVLERGDVIVVEPRDGANLAENTILVFDTPQGRTAHRIKEVVSPVEYITKGDANRDADSTPVHADQVVGVARIAVPLIGRLILFAREDPILKGIPMALLIMAAAWVSRFAIMRRYDPWAQLTPEEVARPAPSRPVDVDRIIEKRQLERERYRREGEVAQTEREVESVTSRQRRRATDPSRL